MFTGRLQVELVAVFARDYSSAYTGPVTAGSGAGQTMMAGYRVAIIKQDNYLGCGGEYRDSGEAE